MQPLLLLIHCNLKHLRLMLKNKDKNRYSYQPNAQT